MVFRCPPEVFQWPERIFVNPLQPQLGQTLTVRRKDGSANPWMPKGGPDGKEQQDFRD
jgi:hypothetical protein